MMPKPDKRERLLAETYHGDWAQGPAARFAAHAAGHARRRRHTRLAVRAAGSAALIALAAFFSVPANQPAPPAPIAAAPEKRLPYDIISDVELLTLVSDRPLFVLMGDEPSGAPRQIVAFDN